MTDLHDLRERLVQELKNESAKVVKMAEMTPTCLDNVYKLIESVKGIDKIAMLEEAAEQSHYSNRPYSGNNSYRNSYAPYYSRHTRLDQMASQLEQMLNDAPNDRVRQAIERALDEMR